MNEWPTDCPSNQMTHWWLNYPGATRRIGNLMTIPGLGQATICPAGGEDMAHRVAIGLIAAEPPMGEGRGTTLMKLLTDKADELGVILEAVPAITTYAQRPDSGPKEDDLVEWYRRRGFTGESADGLALVREPDVRPDRQED